jgi:hypothetical protein
LVVAYILGLPFYLYDIVGVLRRAREQLEVEPVVVGENEHVAFHPWHEWLDGHGVPHILDLESILVAENHRGWAAVELKDCGITDSGLNRSYLGILENDCPAWFGK